MAADHATSGRNREFLIEVRLLDFPEGDKVRYSQGRCEIPLLRVGDKRILVSIEFHLLLHLRDYLEMPSGAMRDPSRRQLRLAH